MAWQSDVPTGSRGSHARLSVAFPLFAYICLYHFEINTNASRARKFGVHRDRAQIRRRL
jgi:hypothetical protein